MAHSALASAAGAGRRERPPSLRRATCRPRLAFLWMEGGHTEWTAYTERLAAIFAGESDVRGPGGGGRKRAASARGAKFCGAGGGSGCARLPSFRRDPPAQPHPGIGFPVGESRNTGIPPTFVLQLHCNVSCRKVPAQSPIFNPKLCASSVKCHIKLRKNLMNTHNNIFIYTEANIISILFQINDVLKFMGT